MLELSDGLIDDRSVSVVVRLDVLLSLNDFLVLAVVDLQRERVPSKLPNEEDGELTIRATEQMQSIGMRTVASAKTKNAQSRWIMDISSDMRM